MRRFDDKKSRRPARFRSARPDSVSLPLPPDEDLVRPDAFGEGDPRQSPSTAQYWCLRTMRPSGPDGDLVLPEECTDERICFEPAVGKGGGDSLGRVEGSRVEGLSGSVAQNRLTLRLSTLDSQRFFRSISTCLATAFSVSNTPAPFVATASKVGSRLMLRLAVHLVDGHAPWGGRAC